MTLRVLVEQDCACEERHHSLLFRDRQQSVS
jgi:hypothetical protein